MDKLPLGHMPGLVPPVAVRYRKQLYTVSLHRVVGGSVSERLRGWTQLALNKPSIWSPGLWQNNDMEASIPTHSAQIWLPFLLL